MGTSEKRPGSITFLLVGLVLLVTIGGGVAAWVPAVVCPRCQGGNEAYELKDGSILVAVSVYETTYARDVYCFIDDKGIERKITNADIRKHVPCPRCNGNRRIPLFNCWRRD
jgi:hypothetical protein